MLFKTAFAGSGGQGVLMMGYVLSSAAMKDGKNVTYLPSYGAEVRGGTANCTVSISDQEIASPVTSSPDYAVVLNKPSMLKYQGIIKSGGLILINSSMIDSRPDREDIDVISLPANEIALELKNERTVNMIMLGAFVAKTGIVSNESLLKGLAEILKGKKESVLELNRLGIAKGAELVS
jgi:2-oxoglutarate ferredoxin oxidoreductase subunit gamma